MTTIGMRWMIPCPFCGMDQYLETHLLDEENRWTCDACHRVWSDEQRMEAARFGRWVNTDRLLAYTTDEYEEGLSRPEPLPEIEGDLKIILDMLVVPDDDTECVALMRGGIRCWGQRGPEGLCTMHLRRLARIVTNGHRICQMTTKNGYCLGEVLQGWRFCTYHPDTMKPILPIWTSTPKTMRKRATPVATKAPQRFATSSVITLLVTENPKREGAAGRQRFALYRTGMTVQDYLDKGGKRSDIRRDSRKGFIKLD